VEEQIKLFSDAGCRLVIVSFGSVQGAEKWKSETKTSLDLFLDPDRILYGMFGLGRSVSKVWGMNSIQYYGAQIAQGRQLPSALTGVEDDPLQMGGDFTMDSDLKLVFSHPSTESTDRPTVDQILQHLSL